MKEASKEIINILKEKGYRVTKARTEVLRVLEEIHEPQTIQSLCTKVTVDEVSVYRTISMLLKEKLIEEVNTQGGMSRYELSHGHHHHVVCSNCEMMVHIACGHAPQVPNHVKGFAEITSHELTFYGLCSKCA